MTSKSMAFRFPAELAQAIEARAKATGRDKTAVVVEALTQAFELPLPSPAPVTVEALQEQLSQLEIKIAIGSKQLAELYRATSTNSTIHLITALAQMVAAQSEPTSAASVEAATPISETAASASQKLADQIPELQSVTGRQQREEMLEKFLSATPDPIFVCDRSGQLTYINSAGTQALGMNRSQLLGKTCQELGLASDLAACETAFATGQRVSGESSISTIFDGTRRYEYILSPIQSISGNIEAVLCRARDITERQQAEMALRKSEASYRHLFESANDGILVLDASTRRILNANWNAARRLGYTRSELLQLSGTDIFVPMADDLAEDIFRELLVTGNLIFKYFQRCKDGTLIPVESSSQAIEYEGRLAIQSCVRDISDR